MNKLAILGSTGSIGTQALDIVRANPDIEVCVLAAGSNVVLMESQIREFRPKIAVLYDEKAAADLAKRVADVQVRVLSGMDGLIEAAEYEESEMVLTSMVGMIGIRPTIAAIKAGKDIALANKETLVCAGHIIIPLIKEMGVKLLPVDSEHSAIFQSMNGEDRGKVSKILLTASGGPFRGRSREELAGMTIADALNHPNWSMGRKITVDSATLVNKGLEVMEAKWLFGVDIDDIEVLIHPQSIIHSMVEYVDGAVIAQLGMPDMKLPIQYAFFYPDRRFLDGKRVDFAALGSLTFEKPRADVFEGFALANKAARIGGSMPTVLNAANERAVALFLDGKIGFTGIPELIGKAMDAHKVITDPSVDEILAAQAEAEEVIMRCM